MVSSTIERSEKAGELDFTWVVRTLFVVCSLPPKNPDLVGWAITSPCYSGGLVGRLHPAFAKDIMEVACMYSLFVGIDVSKDSFSLAGLDEKAKVLFSLCPSMNAQGFSELLKAITSRCDDLSSVIVALESTGPYHLNLFSFLVSQGITTIVINPLIIANFTKLSLRKTKTDKKDAVTIARFLFLNRDSISRLPSTQLTTDLRDLARERESILKMVASMKNDVRRILQTTFPELEQLVDVFSKTMLRFLRVFPSARLITQATPESVTQGLHQSDRRARISVHSAQIIKLASMSVATTSPSKELILPGKIETLFHLHERVREVTRMLVKLCKSIRQEELAILTSIRGIAVKTAAPFLAELGEHQHFRSYKKMLAFAGLDPTTHQSGKFEGMSMISRRGNRHLRKVIYNMTFCVVRYTGPFRDYFFRRKKEGLPFRKALLATAHKLVRTIFAMLNKKTYYRIAEVV
jgi:transposase